MSILTEKSAQILAIKVWFSKNIFYILLQDGRKICILLLWFPGLRKTSKEQLNECRLIGNGVGIHWKSIDEDISIAALL